MDNIYSDNTFLEEISDNEEENINREIILDDNLILNEFKKNIKSEFRFENQTIDDILEMGFIMTGYNLYKTVNNLYSYNTLSIKEDLEFWCENNTQKINYFINTLKKYGYKSTGPHSIPNSEMYLFSSPQSYRMASYVSMIDLSKHSNIYYEFISLSREYVYLFITDDINDIDNLINKSFILQSRMYLDKNGLKLVQDKDTFIEGLKTGEQLKIEFSNDSTFYYCTEMLLKTKNLCVSNYNPAFSLINTFDINLNLQIYNLLNKIALPYIKLIYVFIWNYLVSNSKCEFPYFDPMNLKLIYDTLSISFNTEEFPIYVNENLIIYDQHELLTFLTNDDFIYVKQDDKYIDIVNTDDIVTDRTDINYKFSENQINFYKQYEIKKVSNKKYNLEIKNRLSKVFGDINKLNDVLQSTKSIIYSDNVTSIISKAKIIRTQYCFITRHLDVDELHEYIIKAVPNVKQSYTWYSFFDTIDIPVTLIDNFDVNIYNSDKYNIIVYICSNNNYINDIVRKFFFNTFQIFYDDEGLKYIDTSNYLNIEEYNFENDKYKLENPIKLLENKLLVINPIINNINYFENTNYLFLMIKILSYYANNYKIIFDSEFKKMISLCIIKNSSSLTERRDNIDKWNTFVEKHFNNYKNLYLDIYGLYHDTKVSIPFLKDRLMEIDNYINVDDAIRTTSEVIDELNNVHNFYKGSKLSTFKVDENKLKDKTCLDSTFYDNQDIIEFISENNNFYIFISPDNLDPTKDIGDSTILCLLPDDILQMIKNKSENFYFRCISENGSPIMSDIYVKLPINQNGKNGLINIKNFIDMLITSKYTRVFYLLPKIDPETNKQLKFEHTISYINIFPQFQQYVSANHCQDRSDFLLYEFKICDKLHGSCDLSSINPNNLDSIPNLNLYLMAQNFLINNENDVDDIIKHYKQIYENLQSI